MTTKQIQCLLFYLSIEKSQPAYDPGQIDDVDGPKTQAALAAFRRDYGVGVEGLVGAVAGTVAKLEKPQTGSWWDSIRYFRPDEDNICCPCPRCVGKKEYPTEALMRTADSIREELGPMVPSSVRRCQEHNDELPGSAKNSRHIIGKAMDFNAPKSSPVQIESCLARKKAAGEIRYWYRMDSGWYHFDIE